MMSSPHRPLKIPQDDTEQVNLSTEENRSVIRVNRSDTTKTKFDDSVATEYPLTIYVNDVEMATLVCTPSNLKELVLGFLTAEGVLRRDEQITRFFVDREAGTVHVNAPDRKDALEQEMFAKRYVGSCCGKSRTGFYFANDARTAQKVDHEFALKIDDGFRLMNELQKSSPLFRKTGGVHNAGLATRDQLKVVRTDIGRHNTLDKLYGYGLRQDIKFSQHVVVFSGRISSEIILKISKMGCPVLISQCAPTELALEMAEDLEISTAGFMKEKSCNIYTHPQRFSDITILKSSLEPGE